MALSPQEFRPLVELAAEKTTDGLLCLDTDGHVLYANESAGRILAQSPSLLSEKTLFEMAPEMNPSLWRELWKEIRARGSFVFELSLAVSAERLIQVDMAVHHLKPARRELACVFFRDIEERKRLQNLQQEFVSTASHELRTPMTVIREGVSQVLEGLRGDVNESQSRALTLALSGIDRLGRIIHELLDMSKMESGKIALRRERLDLVALAREVVGSFQSMAADRHLDLRLTTPAAPVVLYADHDRLVQVLTNFLSNSFKFTEKGSIHLKVTPLDGQAECAVTDTGIGLADTDLEKIFNKFEQLGHIAFTGEKGTGLGLSISRGIIDLHKGRIWAESRGAGKGSKLSFQIPRQSGIEVFCEQLSPMLREVARRGGSLSTIIFHLENSKRAPATEGQVDQLLAGLESLVHDESGRMTDLLVKDRNAVYLALQSMVKKEGVRIAERIIMAFQKSLEHAGLQSRLRMSYTIFGFPDEAAIDAEYLKKIARQEAA